TERNDCLRLSGGRRFTIEADPAVLEGIRKSLKRKVQLNRGRTAGSQPGFPDRPPRPSRSRKYPTAQRKFGLGERSYHAITWVKTGFDSRSPPPSCRKRPMTAN